MPKKGYKFTDAQRANLRAAKSRQAPLVLTEEQRTRKSRNIKLTLASRPEEERQEQVRRFKQWRNSPEVREKYRGLKVDYWAQFSLEQRQEMMKSAQEASLRLLKRFDTILEQTVKTVLDTLGVEYVQNEFLIGYYPDFRIDSKSLIIECDGAYWHGRPEAKEHDAIRDSRLKGLGYAVVRLGEEAILADATTAVTDALKAA